MPGKSALIPAKRWTPITSLILNSCVQFPIDLFMKIFFRLVMRERESHRRRRHHFDDDLWSNRNWFRISSSSPSTTTSCNSNSSDDDNNSNSNKRKSLFSYVKRFIYGALTDQPSSPSSHSLNEVQANTIKLHFKARLFLEKYVFHHIWTYTIRTLV